MEPKWKERGCCGRLSWVLLVGWLLLLLLLNTVLTCQLRCELCGCGSLLQGWLDPDPQVSLSLCAHSCQRGSVHTPVLGWPSILVACTLHMFVCAVFVPWIHNPSWTHTHTPSRFHCTKKKQNGALQLPPT